MCRGDPSSHWWCAVLLGLVFLFLARTASAQEPPTVETPSPSPTSSETLLPSEPNPTDSWVNFDNLWNLLKEELIASEADSTKLYASLAELQTEVNGLRISLAESTTLYEQSEAARMIEREAAEARITDAILKGIEAEKKRKTWQAVAFVAGGVAIVETAAMLIALAF